jgi:hypothetical protein
VLALFCLAWLQTAALPCVMAHTAPSGASAPAHHCPYCPPDDSSSPWSSCDDHGNCAYPHQPQVDARDAAALFAAIPAARFVPSFDATRHEIRAPGSALPEPVPRLPLSLTYCRYIE